MKNEQKLFLLDGMALVYRAHFALAKTPRYTSYGLNTSAIMAFTNTLLEIFSKEQPSHLAVVFDTDVDTARHTEFKAYKAHRQEMPEDLAIAIPYIKRLITAFNVPVLTLDGYEADDIIGTLAKEGERKGFTVYCMTPDKDFAQLVSDRIFIYKPAYMGSPPQVLGVSEILSKWGIERINQVTDILGLWGDAVDNIPGIPGIGEKTAKQLIAKYGSLEAVIEQSADQKGKLKENLETYASQGLLSKKLATILLDVPIDFSEDDLKISAPNEGALRPMLEDLELKSIARRVFGEPGFNGTVQNPVLRGSGVLPGENFNLFAQPSVPLETRALQERFPEPASESGLKSIDDTPHQYILCNNEVHLAALLETLKNETQVSFDTETTSRDPNQAELVGMSFCVRAGTAYYVPLPRDYADVLGLLERFKPILEDSHVSKVGQNLKYDMIVLAWYGVKLNGVLFDTMLAHYIIDPDGRHNLDYLAANYLNYTPITTEQLIGKGKAQGSMRDVPLDQICNYAAEDADVTLQLASVFRPLLARAGGTQLAEELESPLIPVLAEMEKEGVRIDPAVLHEISLTLEEELKALERSICIKCGEVFNISSPKQLGEILFDKLKIDAGAKRTKTGQYQTGEDVLAQLAVKNPLVGEILDFRSLQKLKSTYVDSLPLLINKKSGRVHTSYNQAVAATGRLSSNNPNLQNIPIRTQRGREIRKAFLPRDDQHILISADYSQIELRIIAEISKDPGMIDAFTQGIDIHTATASKVYGVSVSEVTSDMRRNAKSVNFGIIYGQSAFGLSQNLGISRKEAAEIISQYFLQYPGIQRYMQTTISFAREHGYVETLMKRRRYLRDINSSNYTVRGFAERNAINAPIQGSAADLIKIAMIKIHNDFKINGLQTKMTMQVHDELVFDAPKGELEEASSIIKENMQSAIAMSVPIVVELGYGKNWLEAH